MRIAMMTNNYKPVVGGVPISIERLTGALRERGHDVTVFAPRYPGEAEEEGVVRYRALHRELPGGFLLPDALDPVIEREFSAGSFDLIHLHHPMLIGYAGMRLARKYGVPLAFTYHTRYEQYLHYFPPYAALEGSGGVSAAARSAMQRAVTIHNRVFTNHCDYVFAPSPLMRAYLTETGTITPVAVLPTGLSDEDFQWNESAAAEIRRRYLDGGQFLFCSVSRLEKEKNLSFLLRAMARLRAERGDCFRLLLIGDGSHAGALRQEAEALGLTGNVRFLGNLPHRALADYYRACDLFLFASRSETQGIVLAEAMAAGLPVVAVEASGVCDVVEDGRNGWRVEQDEAAFAAMTGELMDHAPMRLRLGAGAARTASGLTARGMAAWAESCYQAMIMERRLRDAWGETLWRGSRSPVLARSRAARQDHPA